MNLKEQHPIKGKTPAIIAYLTVFGSIIAIFLNLENKYKFAQYHTRQALLLHLLFLLFGSLIAGFESIYIDTAFYITYIVLWVYGFIGAVSGKMNEIPFVGPFSQKFLNKII